MAERWRRRGRMAECWRRRVVECGRREGEHRAGGTGGARAGGARAGGAERKEQDVDVRRSAEAVDEAGGRRGEGAAG